MKLPYRKSGEGNKKSTRRRLTPKTAAWIVVIIALIAAVAISTGLMGGRTSISLPDGSGTQNQKAASEEQSFTLSDADITVDNVQQVIADLSRPDAYSMAIQNTVYWDTDWSACQVDLYVQDGVFLTEYYNTTQEIERYELIDGDVYYSWRAGKTKYHKGKTGSVTADQNSMIPTYETIADLDKDSITEAGLRTVNTEPCIYCVVEDEDSGYTITYSVSTVTGLLMQADYTKGDTLVRSVVVTTVDSNAPSSDKFVLPDGLNVVTGVQSSVSTTTDSTTDTTTDTTTTDDTTTVTDGTDTTDTTEGTATVTE